MSILLKKGDLEINSPMAFQLISNQCFLPGVSSNEWLHFFTTLNKIHHHWTFFVGASFLLCDVYFFWCYLFTEYNNNSNNNDSNNNDSNSYIVKVNNDNNYNNNYNNNNNNSDQLII